MKVFLMLVSVPLLAIAQLTSGVDTVRFNQDFSLRTAHVTDHLFLSRLIEMKWYDWGMYRCSTKTLDIDFSVFVGRIGSPRPFFIAKRGFSSLQFSVPLNLSDSTYFRKIDSIFTQSEDTENACYLPYTTMEQAGFDGVVVKTSTNKFALLRLHPVMGYMYHPGPPGHMESVVEGYAVRWCLQQNGSTDFKGIEQTAINRAVIAARPPVNNRAGAAAFNILGRRLASSSIKKRPAGMQIVIIRDGSNVMHKIIK